MNIITERDILHLPNRNRPRNIEEAIKKFNEDYRLYFPLNDPILIVGGSIIERWRNIKEFLAPLPVLKLGIENLGLEDICYYVDDLVFKYKPRSLVISAGTEDLKEKTAEEVFRLYVRLVNHIHKGLQNCHIYYLSSIPCPAHIELWGKTQDLNDAIEIYNSQNDLLRYVDIKSIAINDNGVLLNNSFLPDGESLSRYSNLSDILKSPLMEHTQLIIK